ncbi:MAG: LamG-like jellyroll fold domain-containing protein, partial [Verrucomicrobiota bacterium]
AELRLQLRMDSRLAQYENAGHDASSFVVAVDAALDAEADGEDFVSKVVQLTDDGTSRSSTGVPWAIAITSLAACLAFALLWVAGNSSSVNEELPPGVAVIKSLVGELELDEFNRHEGDSVGPGMLEVDGYASLEFYKGARLSVAGPARLELVDPQRVICHFGKIRADVPVVAKGFTVVTAESEIVDLGTEFAMEVGATGQTEVHVFDGEVEAYDADRSPDSKTLLTAGLAMRIKNAEDWETIPVETERFDDLTHIDQLARDEDRRKLEAWRAVNAAAKQDGRLVAYYDFERDAEKRRALVNRAPSGASLDGAIVGARHRDGPWPGKQSLEFKRPSDRVRVHLPGQYDDLTLAAWVRIDGLDRTHSSLMLTDGYDRGEIHWQFKNDGSLSVGVHHPSGKHTYSEKGFMDLSQLGTWFHLATVFNQNEGTLSHYLNGELFVVKELKGTGQLSFGEASIGNWDQPVSEGRSSVRGLNGRIAELMVFQVAVDAIEVKRLALRE